MELTTEQLKQMIKEELDLLQLPFVWASIKKEWESFYWRFEYHNRPILSTLKYDVEEKNQTIKKYPQFFPRNNEEKEWTNEGVRNIWVRDKFDVIQGQINEIKKFYEQKIKPFQNELILQIREQMKYGFDSREAEDLMRIVNDFVEIEPIEFDWFGSLAPYNNTVRVIDWSKEEDLGRWSPHVTDEISIEHLQKQLRRLRFDFDNSLDLISRWKKRIDREKII